LLGVSRGVANPGLYFTAVAISSIVARLLTGRIADQRGRFAAIVPGMIVTAVGLYIVSSAASAEAFILAGAAVGIGFATAQAGLGPQSGRCIPRTHRAGVRAGSLVRP